MNKVDLTPAFLIHRRAFKNNSLLLDFFTYEYGKIRLVGRGLRGSKTNIQMFQHLNISFSGKGELKTISNWEVDDIPRSLKGEGLILGMYANELISRLLFDQDQHIKLFKVYQQFISRISSLEGRFNHWSLRLFENNLLSELGYALDFANDINGNNINQDMNYEYQSQLGFAQSHTGKISGKLLNQLLIEDIDNIPNLEQLKVCRDLNRQRLGFLLGNKPLKSRSLFFTRG